jgi:hypothetical protein
MRAGATRGRPRRDVRASKLRFHAAAPPGGGATGDSSRGTLDRTLTWSAAHARRERSCYGARVLTNNNVLPTPSGIVSPPSRARIFLAALVAGGAFACFTARAEAQSYDAAASDAPPTFMTLDRVDSATRIGFQTGFTKVDEGVLVGGTDAIGFRLNVFGQVMLPQRNVGFYGQLALSQLYVEGENADGFSNWRWVAICWWEGETISSCVSEPCCRQHRTARKAR